MPATPDLATEPDAAWTGPAHLEVPLVLDSPAASGTAQPITVGLPLPRGMLHSAGGLMAVSGERAVPVQAEALAHWSDGSIRWLLVDLVAPELQAGLNVWTLAADPNRTSDRRPMIVRETTSGLVIDTGVAEFHFSKTESVLPQVVLNGRPLLDRTASRVALTDAGNKIHSPHIERVACETSGPVRATVRLEGSFPGRAGCRFVARVCCFAGTGLMRVRLTVHNPRRAKHRGGLWDLGDPGSILFRDLSLEWALAEGGPVPITWRAEPGGPVGTGPVEIYQDSSGGDNWNSRNHVNREGRVPCTLRGYRVRASGQEERGLRASPIVTLGGSGFAIAAAVPEFWQQFPKAITAGAPGWRIHLFPGQFGDLHELQGGEQKTHTLWLNFARERSGFETLAWVHGPAVARSTPEWYAASGAFAHLAPASPARSSQLDEYLPGAVEGPKSFVAGREVIDEYGWRNYGEIYADHEGAYYTGPKPVISHYNNQYDCIFGALLQFCRTGDRRWQQVFDPLARHVADIDIYHTTRDKSAYNGGLFWFTDHYKDAATSSHRTYARVNRPPGQPYGGGPGSSHNFATGLATYYYLTGDPVARAAALSLADWVVAMDDGGRNILGLVDDGPTGLASCTFDPNYHGPGRGPGLSIQALLDGWLLTRRREYLAKAEELIRRVVHPADDIAARDLLNVELRWSYPVFFVALARYLDVKAEAGELDEAHAYARASLLHYAAWMVEHERPYLDRPEELEFPTETWAAQELRKANVLRLAAAHADEPLRGRLLTRGRELADRAWSDLARFETRHAARAIAIVMTEGVRDDWFRREAPVPAVRAQREFDFGPPPAPFVPQKRRVASKVKSLRGAVAATVGLLHPRAWRRLFVR